jgi:coenzyme F420-0:L-glutamate ligase/coenzyme F420-1:gamma-L-glutamate ligase
MKVELLALPGLPIVAPGDDLAALIRAAAPPFVAGDVVVVAQKIVSKAEGRLVDLDTVTPSQRALRLAAETDKDPRLVHLILSESERVLRAVKGVLIVVHKRGYVLANAGIDASNVGDGRVLLLPEDPDASAARLATALGVPVIVNDSLGRAWRNGTVGTALGASGVPSLLDLRGAPDMFGRTLRATEIGLADEIAAAASMVQGQAAEATPVVLVRGLADILAKGRARNAQALIRSRENDLFL